MPSVPTAIEVNNHRFWMYQETLYPDYLNLGHACSFIRHIAKHYCNGVGIDVGSGNDPYPGARPIELKQGDDGRHLADIKDGSLDYVFSSHCLEHLSDPTAATRLWARKLKMNGHLFLYLPHPAMKLWRPGSPWVGSGHKWTPELQNMITMMDNSGLLTVAYSEWPDAYWSFYIVGRKNK